MKLLALMNVSMAMALSSLPCFAQTYAGFRDVRPESTEAIDIKLLNAQKRAIGSLTNFMNNPVSNYTSNPDVKETLDLMYKGLSAVKVEIVLIENIQNTVCRNPNVMFVTPFKRFDVIAICPAALEETEDELYESFIHESYHLYERQKDIVKEQSSRSEYVESEGVAMMYEYAVVINNNTGRCNYIDSWYLTDDADIKALFKEHHVGIPRICYRK